VTSGIYLFTISRKLMVTEIDLLKEDIPRLEIKSGRGNPFVAMLKAQLNTLQNLPGQLPKFDQD